MRDLIINPNTANSKKRACTRKSETADSVRRQNDQIASAIDKQTVLLEMMKNKNIKLTAKERRMLFKSKKNRGLK